MTKIIIGKQGDQKFPIKKECGSQSPACKYHHRGRTLDS